MASVIEDRDGYYQLFGFDFDNEDIHNLSERLENLLLAKKQDLLLSLSSVGILYSSHLATLVRIHQQMFKNKCRLVISDISAEIKNLLQITQLDTIFSIYETTEDFKNNLKISENNRNQKINFEWEIEKIDSDNIKVICKGNMFAGEQLEELQKNILDYFAITFDFTNLQSMDSASVSLFDRITDKHSISIIGVNKEILEQFKQKLIYGKMKLL